MGRRKKSDAPDVPKPNDNWEYVTEMQINGRYVSKGTELKVSGERGRFRFVAFIKTDKGTEWIDVWGGPKGAEALRSFRLDRIKRVHYKNSTDANLAAEYKQKQKDKKEELADSDETGVSSAG